MVIGAMATMEEKEKGKKCLERERRLGTAKVREKRIRADYFL